MKYISQQYGKILPRLLQGMRIQFAFVSVLSVIAGLISVGVQESHAAISYITPISIECDFVNGHGHVAYTLLKNGQVLGTTSLDCSGTLDVERGSIATSVKPGNWDMQLTLYNTDGTILATNHVSGKGSDASATVSYGTQYVFGRMGGSVR